MQRFLMLAALSLLTLPPITLAQSSPPVVVNQGHNPVEVVYEAGSWSFFVDGTESERGRLDPSAVVYHLTDTARLQIPASPRFAFLGNAGDPVWIAPHVENPSLLFLGISGQRIASGIFAGDRLGLRLTGVRGPGDFAMYGLDSGGNVELYQSSRDGIGADEIAPFGIGGHDHQNWAFNAPGHYDLTFKAEGTLVAGGMASSPEITYRFAVGPVDPLSGLEPVVVDEGDADIAVVLRDGQLLLNVFWGAEEAEYRSDEASYEVRANSQISVPSDPAYSFLGSPGDRVWVAPQTDQPGKLFLALAADNLPQGVFTNERVRVTLKTFEGPGTFAVYQTDAFGTPTTYFNTADGVSDADARDVIPGDHFHMNWGFTQPGTYKVGLQAQGVRVSDGQTVASDLTQFTFRIVGEDGLQLGIARSSQDRLTLSWTATQGASYQLQRRASLGSGDWEPLGAPVTGIGGTQTIETPLGSDTESGFYRLLQQP